MFSYRYEEKKSCGYCLRYFMIVENIVFALVAAAVIAVFVYYQITQVDFVSGVLGTPLVVAASALLIAAGCLLLIVAIFGIISGAVDNVTAYAWYFGLLIPVFLVFVAGVVTALVFKTWLTEQVRHKMETAIINDYGVQLDNSWNKKVTDGWNRAQSQWHCCSVDDQSWNIYQKSQWYKEQPGTPDSTDNPKPYVPVSCCVTEADGSISNAKKYQCQNFKDGPPARTQGDQYAGSYNSALYYRGCYQAAQDYLLHDSVSWFAVLVGIGSAVAILMVIGIILSISLYCTRKREVKENLSMSEYQRQFGNPSVAEYTRQSENSYVADYSRQHSDYTRQPGDYSRQPGDYSRQPGNNYVAAEYSRKSGSVVF